MSRSDYNVGDNVEVLFGVWEPGVIVSILSDMPKTRHYGGECVGHGAYRGGWDEEIKVDAYCVELSPTDDGKSRHTVVTSDKHYIIRRASDYDGCEE